MQKIHQKLMSDPGSFPTLQSIVLHEVQTDVAQVRNSATEALLWLRRGLKFLKEFLSEVNTGCQDIQGALSKSGCYDAQSDIYRQVQINVRQCIVHYCRSTSWSVHSSPQIMHTERPFGSTTDGLCEEYLL